MALAFVEALMIEDEPEVTNPGAVPVFVADDAPTINRCVTCGTDLDEQRAIWKAGVKHAVRVIYRQLLQRMSPEEALHTMAWLVQTPDMPEFPEGFTPED